MKSQHAEWHSQKMEGAWVLDDIAEPNTSWIYLPPDFLRNNMCPHSSSHYHLGYLFLAVKYILTCTDIYHIHSK